MRTYIIRRILLAIPTVFLVTFIVFFLIRLIPGDVIDIMAAGLISQGVDIDAARDMLMDRLGLDVPVIVQYGRWLGVIPGEDGSFSGLLQGDLGISLW